MSIDHYENFPVASVLLPAHLRRPVAVIYRFARSADDIADEGQASAAERLAALAAYDAQIERIGRGMEPAAEPAGDMFRRLALVMHEYQLAPGPFHDLLSAFAQDAVTQRYADFERVLDYCTRSANPVGRLMLALYGAASPAAIARSDDVCTALQLINFWQDVAIDLQKDRVYLPLDDLARFELDVGSLESAAHGERFRGLMAFQCDRARRLMLRGAPLALELPGRIGWELRLVVQGGLRILEKIEDVAYDVFQRRPQLERADWPLLAWRAFRMRA